LSVVYKPLLAWLLQLEERSKATEAEALAMQERYQAQLVQAMAALQDLQAEVALVTLQARETDAELAGARDDRRHLVEHHRAAMQQVYSTPVSCKCTGLSELQRGS
jgi:hypothetical protein